MQVHIVRFSSVLFFRGPPIPLFPKNMQRMGIVHYRSHQYCLFMSTYVVRGRYYHLSRNNFAVHNFHSAFSFFFLSFTWKYFHNADVTPRLQDQCRGIGCNFMGPIAGTGVGASLSFCNLGSWISQTSWHLHGSKRFLKVYQTTCVQNALHWFTWHCSIVKLELPAPWQAEAFFQIIFTANYICRSAVLSKSLYLHSHCACGNALTFTLKPIILPVYALDGPSPNFSSFSNLLRHVL